MPELIGRDFGGERRWNPMFRNIGFLLIFACFLTSTVFITGCAPKGAKPETLTELEEAQAACEAARERAKELELRRMDLEEERAAKEARLADLTKERDALKATKGKK